MICCGLPVHGRPDPEPRYFCRLIAALLIVTVSCLMLPCRFILDSHANGAADGEMPSIPRVAREQNIEYWLTIAHGQYRLFSNYPDGIAFYSGHSCNRSPIKNSVPM